MKQTQKIVIQILGQELFGGPDNSFLLSSISQSEVEQIIQEAQEQSVFSIVYLGIKTILATKIDAELFKRLENKQYQYCSANIRNKHDHEEIHRLLSLNGVNYVILKGQASASYYPVPLDRTAGDVDFLINISDCEKVDALLKQAGFVRSDDSDNHAFHWEYHKKRTSIELHWSIPGVPSENEGLVSYFSDVFENARTSIDNSFILPSPFHHGLVLLLHMLSHMTSTGIGLRHLCDWLVFQNSLEEEQFITLFEKPLKEIGLWKFAKVLTQIGIKEFYCEERKWCADVEETLCDEILEDIVSGGNFGVKDDGSRKLQAKLIRDTKTRRIENRRMLPIMVKNANQKARELFPLSKRVPLLLPVGWVKVFLWYRRWSRSSCGKKINKEVVNAAAYRQSLYSQLNLFQKEDSSK